MEGGGNGVSTGISSGSADSTGLEIVCTGDDGGGSFETTISDLGDDIVSVSRAALSQRKGLMRMVIDRRTT